jgi:hypothetical protein
MSRLFFYQLFCLLNELCIDAASWVQSVRLPKRETADAETELKVTTIAPTLSVYRKLTVMINRLWNSATFMTWGNLLIRTLGLVLLMPMVLTKLPDNEVIVWYLFSSLIALQQLVDMGFMQTFSRLISYGMGGAKIGDMIAIRDIGTIKKIQTEPDWMTIHSIDRVMLRIYKKITLIAACLGAGLGTWVLGGPIGNTSNTMAAWSAWIMVLLSSCWMLYGNYYAAYLQGMNEIARVQRWQMITALLATLIATLSLAMGGGLFWTITGYQATLGINVLINIYLKGRIGVKKECICIPAVDVQTIWPVVWPSAIRTGVGVLMSAGLIQLSGIVYAQFGQAKSVASYLLGLQLIRAISSFSQPPFYTKLPVFARLYAGNRKDEIIKLAKDGMRKAYLVFTTGFFLVGWFSDSLLTLMRSNVEFPGMVLWSLLGFGLFFERFGAMHIQLYSITNHIVWHIANGITGVIMLFFSIVLFPFMGVYAFPTALVIGYVCFYAWYCSGYSYRAFNLGFVNYERNVMLPWLAIMTGTACILNYAKN